MLRVVAGGMGRRGDGLTLAQRAAVVAPEVAPSVPSAPAGRAARVRPVVRRHCWVQGLSDAPGRWPGLLVEWRRPDGPGGWEGRVVYVVHQGVTGAVVVEAWLAAPHLSPS